MCIYRSIFPVNRRKPTLAFYLYKQVLTPKKLLSLLSWYIYSRLLLLYFDYIWFWGKLLVLCSGLFNSFLKGKGNIQRLNILHRAIEKDYREKSCSYDMDIPVTFLSQLTNTLLE